MHQPVSASAPAPGLLLTAEQAGIFQEFLVGRGSFRVEAPPGSGKTHLLAQMLLGASQPHLVLMFTRTAQQTLAGRLAKSACEIAHKISTFHAMGARLTELCWEKLGFPSAPRHAQGGEKSVTDESGFDHSAIARRRAQGLYTYSDSLFYLLQILRAKSFRLRYPALIVDEYQDLNSLQWAIVEALLAQSPGRLILLGDRFQAIFRFLAARPDHPLAEALPIHQLTYSHRCCGRIAQFASRITGVPFAGAAGGLVQRHYFARTHDFAREALALLRRREARTAAILCRTNRVAAEVRAYLVAERVSVAGASPPQAVVFWNHPAITWAIDFLENPLARWPTALPFLGVSRSFDSLAAMEHPLADLVAGESARAIRFARTVQAMHDAPALRDALEMIHSLLTFPADWVDPLHALKQQMGRIRSHPELLHLRAGKLEPYRSHGVEVCTIHAAKGREWEQVIVDASLPGGSIWAEQKLVAYVAATRAQQFLDVFVPCFGNAWEVIDTFAFD